VSHVLGFTLSCLLMGAGIAVDVALMTVSKFRDTSLSFRNWTLPITATHIVFPLVGYFLFWRIAEAFPETELWLGVAGFTLVALLIYEVLSEAADHQPFFSITDYIAGIFGLRKDNSKRLVVILAVSWDALLSGPAISAQALADDWSTNEVLISFLFVGVVVATITETALRTALQLQRIKFHDAFLMARFNLAGKFLWLADVGGFGVLSLWHGLFHDGSLYWSISVSGGGLSLAFFFLRRKLMAKELELAALSVGS